MNVEGSDRSRDLQAELDADPTLLEPGTVTRRLPPAASKLGGAIPVRFPADVIDRIKTLADQQGVTVSGWVRAEIARALHAHEVRIAGIADVVDLNQALEKRRLTERALRVASG